MPSGEGFAPAVEGLGPIILPPEAEVINLLTIMTNIRQRLGELEADFWQPDRVVHAINQAQQRFAREEPWSWLYTTTTPVTITGGTSTLELTPEVGAHRHINFLATRAGNTTPYLLKRVTAPEGFQMRTMYAPGVSSYMEFYYLESAVQKTVSGATVMVWKVHFVPVPDVNYTLEYQYFRNPAPLVDETDIPDIPQVYVEAVVAWATADLWTDELNGGGKAQEQFNIYASVLEQARLDERGNVPDTPLIWGASPARRNTRSPGPVMPPLWMP
jgi:hypothetical protein